MQHRKFLPADRISILKRIGTGVIGPDATQQRQETMDATDPSNMKPTTSARQRLATPALRGGETDTVYHVSPNLRRSGTAPIRAAHHVHHHVLRAAAQATRSQKAERQRELAQPCESQATAGRAGQQARREFVIAKCGGDARNADGGR